MRAEAKIRLPEMVARLATEHGFSHGTVKIKTTKSRWGSCTVRNDINLSIALVALPDHLAEYIVLHELCHTVHKNHSARFHALLDRVTGGQSKNLNKELRKYRPDAIR
jgi:predicted metal-dependent hydrolase